MGKVEGPGRCGRAEGASASIGSFGELIHSSSKGGTRTPPFGPSPPVEALSVPSFPAGGPSVTDTAAEPCLQIKTCPGPCSSP